MDANVSKSERQLKVEQQVLGITQDFFQRESSGASMITVTRVLLSPDNRRATIMISVLPREKEKAAYGFIRRNLGELRKYVTKGLKINPVPFLDVQIDEGEKNRQKIDELLHS